MEQFNHQEEVTFLVKFKQKADTEKAVQEVERNADKNSLNALEIQANKNAAAVYELKETSQRLSGF